MHSLSNFDWGWMSAPQNRMRRLIEEEFFTTDTNIYEKHFEVEEGDVVLDLGASIGPFPCVIKDKNPSKIYCVEASYSQFPTLLKNTKEDNITCINKAIWHEDAPTNMEQVYGEPDSDGEVPTFLTPQWVDGIKFSTLIKEYNIDRIDFLKTDCEGGEYDVFNIENLCWLKENLGKVAGEWHLSNPQLKQKFREFRDVFLRVFPNHQIYSVNGVDIKWDLWNEHFIEYYNEVIIYIKNEK
jgi:FkbM family methyltransferase